LRCVDPLARSIERDLRRRLYVAEHVPDDHIVWPAVFVSARVSRPVSWGVPLERRRPAEALGAFAFKPPLADGIDLNRVKFTDQVIDAGGTLLDVEQAMDLTGGMLAVHTYFGHLGYNPFDLLVEMRGLEQVMMDAADRPAELAALMDVITAGYQRHHQARERHEQINQHTSADGRYRMWGFRVHCYHADSGNPLPLGEGGPKGRGRVDSDAGMATHPHPLLHGTLSQGERVKAGLADEWAYVSAQTSSGFGPVQFAELVHPYNCRLAGYFTNQTVYYHGCETLDRKLDVLATLPNLRRLHVSPWSSVAAAVGKFRGRAVLEVHAHPGKVFFGGTADSIRAELRELIAQAEGVPIDLNLSDIHSVNNEPETLALWARIAQELAGLT
jgi:hypothetical protein